MHSGAVELAISVNGMEYATSKAVSFQYLGLSSFDMIVPNSGSYSGGTFVQVHGTNFPFGVNGTAPRCRFGREEVAAEVLSSTLLQCQTPRWDQRRTSAVAVALSFNGIDFVQDTSSLVFQYEEEPVITALSPSSGSIHGMTTIAVLGTSFRNGTGLLCRFGTNATVVPAVFVSSTKVLCNSPAVSSPQKVELEISTNGVDFTASEMVFELYNEATLVSLSPRRISFAGSIEILLLGRNFFHNRCVCCVSKRLPVLHHVNMTESHAQLNLLST